MTEFDVQRQLGQFRERLQRSEAQQKQAFPNEGPTEKFFRELVSPGVKVVRSEFLASTEELAVLEDQITSTRIFLFSRGRPFTKHPEYVELNPVFRTPESQYDYENKYWWADGDFEVHVLPLEDQFQAVPGVEPDALLRMYTDPFELMADRERSKEDPRLGSRLVMKVIDGAHYVYTMFDFDDNFCLTINFFEDAKWDRSKAHYMHPTELEYSVYLPISEMTQEEFLLIQHYLRRVPKV